ncbi:hypothetical protein [Pedobacter psychrophilus]|uniref:hypothetical protein n=1 Tax=Pedobacter psychrophilus TaxID=1826909 RepID=UPI000AEBC10F|nr:hypothetical protein [Pedobacter psychrophilus]
MFRSFLTSVLLSHCLDWDGLLDLTNLAISEMSSDLNKTKSSLVMISTDIGNMFLDEQIPEESNEA